jgi:hypothetical protein
VNLIIKFGEVSIRSKYILLDIVLYIYCILQVLILIYFKLCTYVLASFLSLLLTACIVSVEEREKILKYSNSFGRNVSLFVSMLRNFKTGLRATF